MAISSSTANRARWWGPRLAGRPRAKAWLCASLATRARSAATSIRSAAAAAAQPLTAPQLPPSF
eukprot:scaffold5276_cov55-Phaeocystis_antarctica.AAC.3